MALFASTLTPRSSRILLLLAAFASVPAGGARAGDKDVVAAMPPPAASEDAWQFQIKPYGWATGLDGTTGIGGLSSAVDVDAMDVINHLNWAFFLQAEARKGRWGLLFDGFYAELSGGGTPPNGLYSQADFTLNQGMAELAVAYRLVESPVGFVDVFGGARYSSLEVELNAWPSESGVQSRSEIASDRIISEVTRRVETAVARRAAELKSAAESRVASVKSAITSEVSANAAAIEEKILSATAEQKEAAAEAASTTKARIELTRALVAARVAEVKSEASNKLETKVAAAEKKLAKAIEKEMRTRLPRSASDKKDWIDPFVGLRAQWNITGKLFLAGRGDIGGFGVGSDLTWQASLGLGYQFNPSWSAELGYRYMDTDYSDGAFTYDMATGGLYANVGYRF